MNCPNCKSNQLVVVDSRPQPEHVDRRRECLVCGLRFNTIEIETVVYKSLIMDTSRTKKLLRQ